MTEQISALTDDEIFLDDAEHLMTSLQAQGNAAEIWGQYHLIGDVMRGTAILSPNFKQNLMAKIDLEPTVLSPNVALMSQSSVLQKSAKTQINMPYTWSIAASVAGVTLVGWMVLQLQVTNHLAPIEVAQVDTASAKSSLASTTEQVAQTVPAEYLMAHQSSAPTASSYYIQSASYAP